MRYLAGLLATTALVFAAPVANSANAKEAALSCRGAISWSSARSHAGSVATVRGRVVETYYARFSTGSPTFLDLGVGYPDSRRFTAIIWNEDRSKFGLPERRYHSKSICVRGLIEMYAGRAQVTVRSPAQIRLG
jgi:hypothetical protein